MSHYIEATFTNTQTVELGGDTTWRTLDAIMRTGFDLYGAYDASHLYVGSSGAHKSICVAHSLAHEAFLNSLSWAIAVNAEIITEEHAEGEMITVGEGVPVWRLKGVTLEEHLARSPLTLPDELDESDLSSALIEADLLGSLIRCSTLSHDIYARAFKATNMIIDFTWSVFKGTQSGPACLYFG